MEKALSKTFRSLKPHSHCNPNSLKNSSTKPRENLPPNKPSSSESPPASRASSSNPWVVYLILSTNHPVRTYVGVTNNFSRRLKQHNGEVKGGAKSSRAGRPWICACLIEGFDDKSHAYSFEAKWKISSRKLSQKRSGTNQEQTENPPLLLLRRRYASLNKVKCSNDCNHLEVNWCVDPL
ncbi:structure-specific endonuclease subunit slx1 [Andrographis paniculata]|uniref:structure-specific endonuclease subunit slx1 n=1 Tax=Andrographis paniculata TaxID=175694 RepID=UPI0021E8E845|nr:structure-specific endonuclease subunit slx1 [Andrographis paniculata]